MNLGPYELNTIITGDARELAKAIPDESVDLIFTDPVYDRIDDYRWLAETAARVLKPDRALLAWAAVDKLHQCINTISLYLSYSWLLTLFKTQYTGSTLIQSINIVSKQDHCLWFNKGQFKPSRLIWDIAVGKNLGRFYRGFKWNKDPGTIIRYINVFTDLDSVIFDPFTGGGTVPAVCKMLHRNYLAFEIDPDTADLARKRVAETQPPLPLVMPEQMEMEL
jgi:DNA modification methylase